jgi:hypothetical protein
MISEYTKHRTWIRQQTDRYKAGQKAYRQTKQYKENQKAYRKKNEMKLKMYWQLLRLLKKENQY